MDLFGYSNSVALKSALFRFYYSIPKTKHSRNRASKRVAHHSNTTLYRQ